MYENVRRWFDALPPAERDVPLLSAGGVAYSPRKVLDEVARGTAVGQQLQQMVESRSYGSPAEEEYRLASIRLKYLLSQMPQDKPMLAFLGPQGRAFTPREILREVEAGSAVGQWFIQGQLIDMSHLMSL